MTRPTDFRALCAEQMADGPAVPEDREPASVAGESSGENCWRWYAYCPEEGIEMYSDKKQAQLAAQSIMDSHEVAAHSDGWHEDMESVSWGMLVPVEQAQVVERKTAEFYDEFSEWVKYELRPARFGHQPAPPAEEDEGRQPSGYAYRYQSLGSSVIRFNGGGEVNGSRPVEAIPYWWGRPPQPVSPDEGEVAELVADLRSTASGLESQSYPQTAALITRAAALLEQRHPAPVPAATETRYEFCVYDENYIAQAGGTAPTYAQALSEGRHYLAQYQQDGPHTLELRRIELLPLPAEEPQS